MLLQFPVDDGGWENPDGASGLASLGIHSASPHGHGLYQVAPTTRPGLSVGVTAHMYRITYLSLGGWAICEFIAWHPRLDLHRLVRYRLICLYIFFFLVASAPAIHGW